MKKEHKRCLKRIAAAALVMLMASGTVPFQPIAEVFDTAIVASADIVDTGTFDNGVTWTLDSDGKLTVSGNGDIPEYVFNFWDIQSVVIENGITSIGDNAFYYCRSLTSVTIPDSVTSIGAAAFAYCSSLTSVTIPDSVTSIGKSAFLHCSSLTSVTIPDSVTSIGDYAFGYCSGLTSVTIPDSVTSIGDYAFYNDTSITDVYCYADPNDLTWIDNQFDFKYNKATNFHVLPNYLSTYQEKFSNLNVTFVGDLLEKIYLNEEKTVWYTFDEETGTVTVSGTGEIPKNAFYCKNIQSVVIENGITSIGDYAFFYCSSLTSVTIPDSVKSIGYAAFAGCSSLTSVTIPDSVKSIGYAAFAGCSSLTSVTIPDSVTSIGDDAFFYCSSLTSVTIPDSVKSIGESAFVYCSSLTSVTIPDSVTSIGNWTFDHCSSLTSVTIPDSVTSIGNWTFDHCSSLTSVTIPDSVTSIGDLVFAGSNSIADVYCYADPNVLGCGKMEFDDWYSFKEGKATKFHVLPNYLSTYQEKFSNLNVTFVGDLGLEKIDATAATCTEAGNIEYYKDSDGKYYKLENDDCIVITEEQTKIPATGHSYGEPTWSWIGTESATAKFVCTKDDDTKTENAKVELTSETPATYETTGKKVYTATVNFNGQTYTDTKTVEIPKLEVKYTKVEAVAATCEKDGNIEYYKGSDGKFYKLDNDVYTEITKEDTIVKATGHDWGEWTVTTPATATTDGVETRVCKNDPTHTETRVIEKTAIASGECNSNISWVLDKDGVLTITGSGAMTDYTTSSGNNVAPWNQLGLNSQIKAIVIEEGITTIGNTSFIRCENVESVKLPSTLTKIGVDAFNKCRSLTSITIPENVTDIRGFAFSCCDNLSTVYLCAPYDKLNWSVNDPTEASPYYFMNGTKTTVYVHSVPDAYSKKFNKGTGNNYIATNTTTGKTTTTNNKGFNSRVEYYGRSTKDSVNFVLGLV